MITKAQLKQLKSLQLKKNRQEQQRFLVEGAKSVLELPESDFEIEMILGTEEFMSQNGASFDDEVKHMVSENLLGSIGTFKNNTHAIAVVKMKPNDALKIQHDQMGLVLDDVRDPGNLGTIIRIADWYGINTIIASETTADFYNPKVINSSMGSFTRVNFFYTNLPAYLTQCNCEIMGTFMEGQSIHEVKKTKTGLVVLGNESNGISKEVEEFVTKKITIPRYGNAESLNVAVATAIVCDNLLR